MTPSPPTGSGDLDEGSAIPVPPPGAPWFFEGIEFALTYNGYERHGGLSGARRTGERVRRRYDDKGTFTANLRVLRCALFWEQRWVRANEMSDPLADPAYAAYLDALMDRIREVSGGAVPGPADPLP